MYVIAKQFHFSASHILEGLPDGHPCGRLHGHNYAVELRLSRPGLNHQGFVKDYGELKPFSDHIDSTLDHRHLNDVLEVQPSAEQIAKYLYAVALILFPDVMIHSVRVSETPKTWAEYSE